MSENENGGGASENTDEKVDALTDEELEDAESVEKSAYINQRTRAEKSEAESKTLGDENKTLKEQLEAKDKPEKSDKGLSFSDVAKISTEIKDMTSEELELLNLEAQKLEVEPDKFIKSDAWKAYLTKHRSDEAEKNKTPNASDRVVVHDNKSYKEIMSNPESSKEDKQKAYEGLMIHKFKK